MRRIGSSRGRSWLLVFSNPVRALWTGCAGDLFRGAASIQRKQNPDPRAEPIRAEVQYVCRHEMVCTLEDLFDRRAGFLYWNPEKRLERLRHGAHVIREELGLSEAEFEEQFEGLSQAPGAISHTMP